LRKVKAAPVEPPKIEAKAAPADEKKGKKRGGRSSLNKATRGRLNFYIACRLSGLDDKDSRDKTTTRQGVGIGKRKSEREGVNRAVEKYLDAGADRDWGTVKF
jgi:hypothetical protein